MDMQTKVKLNDGYGIPIEALGVWKMTDQTQQAVIDALQIGYRHIDTASFYKNEEEVGNGLKASGIAREDIFVTTKVWTDDIRAGKVKQSLDESLQKLQLDYVDLYLLHWPAEHSEQAFLDLIDLQAQGKIKSIGVSNFKKHHLERLIKACKVTPAVDQIELNPGIQDNETIAYCRENDIVLEAWAPLGRGKYLENMVIQAIANEYNKSTAQVILRWLVQQDIVVLPKSVHKERMIQNSEIFDFELTADEMQQMADLNKNERIGLDPDTFDF